MSEEPRCEITSCGAVLEGKTAFDKFYRKRVCWPCWEQAFRVAEQSGIGEWFEANYDQTAYPPEFWRKVGAFIDLSKTKAYDPYRKPT